MITVQTVLIKENTMKLAEIDLQHLDTLLQTHAYEFQAATEELPSLRREMTASKLNIDSVESSLYLAIRRSFEDNGEKFTEGKITATIKSHKSYLMAHEQWLDAREAYDKVDQLREIFMQREASIKNLVSLYHAQYWSLGGVDVVPKAASESNGSRFKKR